MQIHNELERLEQQMAERRMRGHIYLTPEGPPIYTSTTTDADEKTGQSAILGPQAMQEALGSEANAIISEIIEVASRGPRSASVARIPPVLWNTRSLVVTGTTAAHALIVALYHANEYNEQRLADLAERAPWRSGTEIRTAFEETTGVAMPSEGARWINNLKTAGHKNRKKNHAKTTGISNKAEHETMFTQYASELIRDGEAERLSVLIVRGIPRSFNRRPREVQAEILGPAPAVTETKWDGVLAAMAEHLAWLHGHPRPEWVDEEPRFNNPPTPYGPVLRENGLATPPGAFIRHGALLAGRELDARGGENVQWEKTAN